MFPKVSITESLVLLEFSTWDKFLNASRKDLTIPRANIVSIDIGPEILKECKGFRAPGTYTFSQTYGFGVIAGTYRQRHGVKHFWNVRAKLADHTIRFNLIGDDYTSVVVQVEDPISISRNLTVLIVRDFYFKKSLKALGISVSVALGSSNSIPDS